MSLQNKSIRIIVHQPENWNQNLFGTIILARGTQKLVVKLLHKITGAEITSDILELEPLTEQDKFRLLELNYSVMVKGSLKCNTTNKTEQILSGSITID